MSDAVVAVLLWLFVIFLGINISGFRPLTRAMSSTPA